MNINELSKKYSIDVDSIKSKIKRFNEFFGFPFKQEKYWSDKKNRYYPTYAIAIEKLSKLPEEFFNKQVQGFKKCEKCETLFAFYDIKDANTQCRKCKEVLYNTLHECGCGCGKYIRGDREYDQGHHFKNKTYAEIYGHVIPNCGFKKGEKNVAKKPEIRKKISDSIIKSYSENPLLKKDKFKKSRCNKTMYSKISQVLFWDIYNFLEENDHIYFGELNAEFQKTDNILNIGYYYDFTKTDNKKIIEFNGDIFHANPKIFDRFDCPNPFNKNQTAEQIWEKDYNKIKIVEDLGFEVLIIWYSNYLLNPDKELHKCINFIKGVENENNQEI